MEVTLPPHLESSLTRRAEQQGCDTDTLIAEAVERLVQHDEWFAAEVEESIAAADRGQLIDHHDVRKLLDSRYGK